MADEAPEGKPPDGVFGNLPSTRPGTRSPRRGNGGEEADRPEPSAKPRAAKPAPPPPPEPAPAPESGSSPDREPATGQRIGSVEDLAWAGIAVAAQAATVGVKFASRALEAARKSVDRPD